MGRAGVEHLHTYVRPTKGAEIPQELDRLKLLEGTPELLDEIRRTIPKLITRRKYSILAARLEGGVERVFFARDKAGDLVGWCHFIRGSGPNSRINHTLRLRSTDVFLYDAGVDPGHRRRGVHSFMILRRLQIAAQEGCTRAVSEITDKNEASIRSLTKLGFERRSHIVYVPALNRALELPWRSSWARGLRRGR